jgi:hypothetical protein
MSFDALVEVATKRIHDLLGSSVVYVRAGGSAVTISGVFDRRPVYVETEDGSTLTYSARVSFAASSLPYGYAEGDGLTVSGVSYVVMTLESDGHGQIDMMLRRA